MVANPARGQLNRESSYLPENLVSRDGSFSTQLRTDGVHCRESAGTGPVVLKVVPATGAAFAGYHGPIHVRLSFSHTHYD